MSHIATTESLVRSYRVGAWNVPAVAGISLTVDSGELVALVGPSGCGKTTLLNLIAGLDVPDAGTVTVAGQSVQAMTENQRSDLRLRHVGMVFQESNLIAQLTAGENVQLVLRFQGDPNPRRAAFGLLRQVGIEELADRYPSQMSGGQRQRVGIARALAGNRTLLLCDEPTVH
ncbi:MAG: ABC transporter ATP-binding protein [Micropruina sp.]|uniref:ABC transporter ATP-binding protein n=1 Tax=Micropruina sp. TaxID=2737536 RepID=UPI0039E4EF7E